MPPLTRKFFCDLNYVERVMENLQVYQARFASGTGWQAVAPTNLPANMSADQSFP